MNFFRPLLFSGVVAAGAACVIAQSPATTAPASTISVATGIDYSRGDYGFPTDTEVVSAPLDLSFEKGSWIWRANFSWLNIKGPATVVGAGAAARPTASSESGVGDIYLGATYRMGPVIGAINFDSTVRVKIPTASESRGLGTGETDVYGQVDAYRTFGNLTPFVTLGYRALGDNSSYQLHDGVYTSGGLHFRTSPETIITTAVSWGERLIVGGQHTSDAMLAVTHDVDSRWRLMGYASKGFTNASPDFGAGARIIYKF